MTNQFPTTPYFSWRTILRFLLAVSASAILIACAPQTPPATAAPSLTPAPSATVALTSTPTSTFTPEPTATATSTPTATAIPDAPALINLLDTAKAAGMEMEKYTIEGNVLLYDGNLILSVEKTYAGDHMVLSGLDGVAKVEKVEAQNMTSYVSESGTLKESSSMQVILGDASYYFAEGEWNKIPSIDSTLVENYSKMGGHLALVDGVPNYVVNRTVTADGGEKSVTVQLTEYDEATQSMVPHQTSWYDYEFYNLDEITNVVRVDENGKYNQADFERMQAMAMEQVERVGFDKLPVARISLNSYNVLHPIGLQDFSIEVISMDNAFVPQPEMAMVGEKAVMITLVGRALNGMVVPISLVIDKNLIDEDGVKTAQENQDVNALVTHLVGAGGYKIEYFTKKGFKMAFVFGVSLTPEFSTSYKHQEEIEAGVWDVSQMLTEVFNEGVNPEDVPHGMNPKLSEELWRAFSKRVLAAFVVNLLAR